MQIFIFKHLWNEDASYNQWYLRFNKWQLKKCKLKPPIRLAKDKTLDKTMCWQGFGETSSLKSCEGLNGHKVLTYKLPWPNNLIPRNWPIMSIGPYEQRIKSVLLKNENKRQVKKKGPFWSWNATDVKNQHWNNPDSKIYRVTKASCRTVYTIF